MVSATIVRCFCSDRVDTFPVLGDHDQASYSHVYKSLITDSWYRKIGYYALYESDIYYNIKVLLIKKFLYTKLTSFSTLQMTRDAIELFPPEFDFDLEILRNTISATISEMDVYHNRNAFDLRLSQASIPTVSTH